MTACMYITGHFPSHHRPKTIKYLRQIGIFYKRPTCFDGRFGHQKPEKDAVRVLKLNDHEMVKAVGTKMREGYFIQKSRGVGTRNGYSKVFMFKLQNGTSLIQSP